MFLYSCNHSQTEKYDDENGLLIESFKSNDIDENKYNINNNIYIPGRKFTFKYNFTIDDTDYFYVQNGDKWKYISSDSLSFYNNVTTEFILEVAYGNPIKKYMPDYNQTVIKYSYPPVNSFNATGLVENEKNIWLHPPRQSLFRILELNPFPYIKYPLKKGVKWDWELSISDNWADKRWAVWEGSMLNYMEYEIVDEEYIETPFGKLNCFVVKAYSYSKLGVTSMIAYFNEKYGFVDIYYENINGSCLNLTLTKIEE